MPWIDVAAHSILIEKRWLEVEAGREAVLLFDLGGEIHATAAICPHHSAFLSQGGFDGEHVDCPRHQGRFDIRTGAQLRGPVCDMLKVYPVKLQSGRVLVEL
jgi:nitrite reductase/ring-hydroxylating ferredoxin subunit